MQQPNNIPATDTNPLIDFMVEALAEMLGIKPELKAVNNDNKVSKNKTA